MSNLTKIIIGIIVIVITVIILVQISDLETDTEISDITQEPVLKVQTPDLETDTTISVIMPTKASRPGCDETDSCYIPSKIIIKPGQSVTWINQDSAFHSVTSGTYDNPKDDFDSGYLDPYQTYTLTFDNVGIVDYFCTLHPWMYGQVIIS